MKNVPSKNDAGRRGQAMTEYVIVMLAFILLGFVFAALLYTLRQNTSRVLDLVASEYP
ncbi:MAG: hypothetical protein FWF96_04525 [Kiritimatiellaeota bacterium]|nr:hypothetical protein [Kiritimatiellota bacterium]